MRNKLTQTMNAKGDIAMRINKTINKMVLWATAYERIS